MEKLTIATISDHPLIPSGVGLQTRYLIEGLLKTGKYRFRCLGAAIKHADMRPQRVMHEQYGDDWMIWPIEGYGERDKLRLFLQAHKPDALLIVTDPRFYVWLFEMAHEFRKQLPLLYWHVWDNDPTPDYNDAYYNSVDGMSTLSLKTYGLLQDMTNRGLYFGTNEYIPHAVPAELFKPVPDHELGPVRDKFFGQGFNKKFVMFWNNRNARRKMPGDVIDTFGQLAQAVGHENVHLVLHSDPRDGDGQDLYAVTERFGLADCVRISSDRLPTEDLNLVMNLCDCTVNIANNEGFGLSTLESLMSGLLIVPLMTGGLQFQIGDWWEGLTDFSDQDKLTYLAKKRWEKKEGKWWGVPVFPDVRSCVGSQPIPYIYDDRPSHKQVVSAYKKILLMSREERKKLGLEASAWAEKTFNMQRMISSWDSFLERTIQNHRPPATKFFTI